MMQHAFRCNNQQQSAQGNMIHVYKEKEIAAAKAMTRERSKAERKRKLELRVNPVRPNGNELPPQQAKKVKAVCLVYPA